MVQQRPAADRLRALLGEVVEYTERVFPEEHLVGLYAYGSFARGEVDDWSDLDVCAVNIGSDAAYASAKPWAQGILDGFGGRVDPLNVPVDRLGADVCWWWALTLRDLTESSVLLLGRDVRGEMADPAEHKVHLSASWGAGGRLRGLYRIGQDQLLPGPPFALPPLDEATCDPKTLYHACVQLLRAILLLERGCFPFSQWSIPGKASRLREMQLEPIARDALALRQAASAGRPRDEWVCLLRQLRLATPYLAERWLRALAQHGLEDPAYEPDGTWSCNGDGTPAS